MWTNLIQGKDLFVPKIDKSSARRMDIMKIYDRDDLTSLPSGVWGIKEPDDNWNGHKRLSGPLPSFIFIRQHLTD